MFSDNVYYIMVTRKSQVKIFGDPNQMSDFDRAQVYFAETAQKNNAHDYLDTPDVIQLDDGSRFIHYPEQAYPDNYIVHLADGIETTIVNNYFGWTNAHESSYEFAPGEVIELMRGDYGRKCDHHRSNTDILSSMYWHITQSIKKGIYPADWLSLNPITAKQKKMLLKYPDYNPTPADLLYERFARREFQTSNCTLFSVVKQSSHQQASKLELTSAACKTRLCPFCAWRRSHKNAAQMQKIITQIEHDHPHKYRYLFLTLTTQNVFGAKNLSAAISKLLDAWRRLTHMRKNASKNTIRFNQSVAGWYRGLEVTVNHDPWLMRDYVDKKTGKTYRRPIVYKDSESGWMPVPNPWYLSYHPHIHVILCVPAEYFDHSGLWIGQKEFLQMWRDAMQDQSITDVDIRTIKPNRKYMKELGKQHFSAAEVSALATSAAICEITKYTLKPSDYIVPANSQAFDTACKIVGDLDLSIARRQLIGHGGIMLDYFYSLGFKDPTEDFDEYSYIPDQYDPAEDDVVYKCYAWHSGIKHYIRIDDRISLDEAEQLRKERK